MSAHFFCLALPGTGVKRGGWHLAALLGAALALPAAGHESEDALFFQSGQWHVGAERLTLPGNESMGMLGGGYLLALGRGLYVGPEVYAAVSGQRGGFFTGGLDSGWRGSLAGRWGLDGGLFVGGGGGGAAPQGGGLMLRPHVGVTYDLPQGRAGLGYGWVKFPNGAIDSRQWYLSWEQPYAMVLGGWGQTSASGEQLVAAAGAGSQPVLKTRELAALVKSYFPSRGVRDTAGRVHDARMDLTGVAYTQYFSPWYSRVETLGALGGEADGYAEIIAGGGHRWRVASNQSVEAGLLLGAGGGGAVSTGGGALGGAELVWKAALAPGWQAQLRAGFVDALDGAWRTRALTLGIGHVYDGMSLSGGGAPLQSGETYPAHRWRWHVVHQEYALDHAKSRKNGAASNVRLLGGKADLFIDEHRYISGHALGAYDGGAGGYAVGMLGVGWQSGAACLDALRFNAEALLGAGGGGGLAVGGGLLAQLMAGLSYDVAARTAVHMSAGRLSTPSGDLSTNVWELGLSYRFSTYYLPQLSLE